MKATFFVTGNNLGKGPIDDPKYGWDTVIKRMHDDGHQIASHTWGHADLDSVNEEDRRAEMVSHSEVSMMPSVMLNVSRSNWKWPCGISWVLSQPICGRPIQDALRTV